MYEIFVQLLDRTGKKASDVAKATGIPSSTFSDWKKGKSSPKAEKLQKIADYFGVSVDYLMTGKDELDEKKNPYRAYTYLTPRKPRTAELTLMIYALQ